MTLGAASASGVGSLPGTDAAEWCRVIRETLPDLPHLPELPARGPGADMVGRTLGMLNLVSADFSAATTTSGWAISRRQSGAPRDLRRAQSWLAGDLDAVETQFADYCGPFKIQMTGPWTLAAFVESAGGERLLADAGACRDLAAGVAEAAIVQISDTRRRVPGAEVILQVDEPGVTAVLSGGMPVASGLSRHAPASEATVEVALAAVAGAVNAAGAVACVHCCAPNAPIDLFRRAGFRMVSVDVTVDQSVEAIGACLESDVALVAGLQLPDNQERDPVRDAARPLLGLLGRVGLPIDEVAGKLVVTPTCGLSGTDSPASARRVYEAAGAAARLLRGDDGPARADVDEVAVP